MKILASLFLYLLFGIRDDRFKKRIKFDKEKVRSVLRLFYYKYRDWYRYSVE